MIPRIFFPKLVERAIAEIERSGDDAADFIDQAALFADETPGVIINIAFCHPWVDEDEHELCGVRTS